MSSREIAERTGKRHDHVLRDIDNLLAELGETSPQLWGHLPDAYGRPQRVAFLPKDLTLTLVAGYSAPLRHRIVTRWMELEQAQAARPVVALPNFTDPAEAARAWALSVFDRIKEVQRHHAAVSGQRMTITEVVSHIVQAHQRHESQERSPRAALLR